MNARFLSVTLLGFLCLSLMSFKGINKRIKKSRKFCHAKKMTQKRFCYLRATRQSIEDGDVYVYSEIIEFDQRHWKDKRDEIVTDFEDDLYQMYPKSTFEVSFECVKGVFHTKEEAVKSKNAAIQSLAQQHEKINSLKKGLTVRF
ncbi:MAG: hypothetical protein ACPGJS_02800 [Flammeovirgaceae bacterium]